MSPRGAADEDDLRRPAAPGRARGRREPIGVTATPSPENVRVRRAVAVEAGDAEGVARRFLGADVDLADVEQFAVGADRDRRGQLTVLGAVEDLVERRTVDREGSGVPRMSM